VGLLGSQARCLPARPEQDRRPARLGARSRHRRSATPLQGALSSFGRAERPRVPRPEGRPHTKFGAAELLRGHLRAIGLAEERPELFESTAQRKQIRVHDLRGTFVTVSLANNKTESWISDRTGHRSSAMINNYKRVARGFQELEIGTLSPLDSALPELRALASAASSDQPLPVGGGPEVGHRSDFQQETLRPQGDSNPCYSLERAVSWAGLDDGDFGQGRGKIV
jgi:hypothetical protein